MHGVFGCLAGGPIRPHTTRTQHAHTRPLSYCAFGMWPLPNPAVPGGGGVGRARGGVGTVRAASALGQAARDGALEPVALVVLLSSTEGRTNDQEVVRRRGCFGAETSWLVRRVQGASTLVPVYGEEAVVAFRRLCEKHDPAGQFRHACKHTSPDDRWLATLATFLEYAVPDSALWRGPRSDRCAWCGPGTSGSTGCSLAIRGITSSSCSCPSMAVRAVGGAPSAVTPPPWRARFPA